MDLFVDGKLNTQILEMDVRHATHDLSDVLMAAADTQSPNVESTHFLIAVAKVPNGVTQKSLARRGLSVEQWSSGLSNCAQKSTQSLPPAHLTENSFHETGIAMLQSAKDCCSQYRLPRISETVLLLSGLRNLTPEVQSLCESADIDVKGWQEELEKTLEPTEPVAVFAEEGTLILESFSPGAKKVLKLMKSEAESLGYRVADPRHLLLAFLEHEGGVSQYGLYHQGVPPKKIQEAVMLSLRLKAKKERTVVALERDHLQPILRGILELSGELAGRDHASRITEAHLLRGFLLLESTAKRILEDEGVKIMKLRETAETYEVADEEEEEDMMADIQTVRQRLLQRLVGQDEAIERILPYIQRMRFGFTTPGHPVGVFLFCGQSGSGKTEMAKELARAVYGSEENLIFLEMGQFNSPESMNIFVGAPPGYIGYGEGKLTNGLRDKPRAVILFDEVEKAHAKVLDALLRFLDEGKIDDPAGPVRDGSQGIVILTSNVGATELSQLWGEVRNNPNWRTVVRERLRELFKKHNFRVEFLNRVDELILFRTLTAEDYVEITNRVLKRDLERLRKQHRIEVTPDESIAKAIGAYCDVIGEGARAAHRLTQSVVITPVIDFVLQNPCDPPVRVRVNAVQPDNNPACEPTGKVEFA